MAVVRTLQRGATFRVTIDRPESKNAINLDVILELLGALDQASQASDARVVVLDGTGGDFSAGGDIKDMVARRGKGVETYERLRVGLSAIVRALTQHEKPVLARVDGACVGAGAGIALACDAVLATQRSTFGFPFVKVGLVPDTATSWLLPHIVGVQQARRLLLSGDLINGEEAASLGLITRLAPDTTALDAELDAWTTRWAALPPTAVRDAKRLFWTNLSAPISTALVHEAMMQGLRFTTPEHAAAVDAFLAKKGAR